MQNYDFECNKCKHIFSVEMSIIDRAKVTCPECNTKKVRHLFGASEFPNAENPGSGCEDCPSGGNGNSG